MSEQNGSAAGHNEPGRRWLARKRLCLVLVAVLAILAVFVFCVIDKHRMPDLDELLARANLAKLPESAKNLQVDTRFYTNKGRPVPNQGRLYARFQAEPGDANDFITHSRSIDGNRFRQLSAAVGSDLDPAWWVVNQSASGRICSFSEQKDIHGIITVDNDSGSVLIYMMFAVNPQARHTRIFLENLKDDVEELIEDVYHEVKDVVFGD